MTIARCKREPSMTAVTLALTGFLVFLASIVGARRMMLVTMLVRPSCDHFFGWLKESSVFVQLDLPGPGAAINGLVIVLALIAVLRVPGIVLVPPILAWVGFLCAALASLPHTTDPNEGVRVVLTLTTYAAVFAIPYALVHNHRALAQCLTVALCSSFIPSIYALLELAQTPAILTGEQRLESTFTHPNIYAFYIISVMTLILFLTYSETVILSKFMRRMLFVYMGYLFILLLATKTRSAWIAMLIIMAAHAIVVDRRWLLMLLALPAVLLIPGVSGRIWDLESGTIDAGFATLNSFTWRQVLWENTLEWMSAHPPGIFGHGLGSYVSYVPEFFWRGEGQAGVGPHNAFLQIRFEMGAAGITSLLLLIVAVAVQLLHRAKEDFAGSFLMLMMLGGYMVVFYSDNVLDYLQFQWFFWFTLGSVCASSRFVVSPSHPHKSSMICQPARAPYPLPRVPFDT
jgi:O-antigen ligase